MVNLKNWQTQINEFQAKDVNLPQYDVESLKKQGMQNPVWIHFGGGNLYRGFHAEIAQKLADQHLLDAGVIVCETFDPEVVTKAYRPFENNILDIVMHADGKLDKSLLAGTAASFYCQPDNVDDFSKVESYFKNPSLQFVTLTITEKGYGLTDTKGDFLPIIRADIENGPAKSKHTMSIITALLYKRYLANQLPIAMVSTDNFSQNGKRFQESVEIIAKSWINNGLVEEGFIDYINNPHKVSFPWSMIDRITPNPSEKVKEMLTNDGFDEMDIIHTEKRTNIAPFTNTEVINYLVIEDSFPNGRPAIDKAGVILTDRETVDKADVMKVTTCLNPLHTTLAVAGCVLGYTSIAEEMKDKDLVSLIQKIGYLEGLPVVESPEIIDPKNFIDEVIQKRLPNPNIPDTPQRIASDTSQKVAIRFGETIKKYLLNNDKKVTDLVYIPIALATWLRYLLAIDDDGKNFTPSPDPLLEELQNELKAIKIGECDGSKVHDAVAPILKNKSIFGLDLYEIGMAEKIEKIFLEMLKGNGAVRKTLHKYVTEEII
jgi:fructuronate reductase